MPSTVNGTRKLAAGQDKEEDTEKTQKRRRKDTKKEKTINFFSDEAKFGLQTSPRREDLVFYWFQTSPAEVCPRSQTLPLMSCSPVRAIQNLYFFSRQKASKKLIFVPQKTFFCYYNTLIHELWLVSLYSKRVKAIFSFLKKNLRKRNTKIWEMFLNQKIQKTQFSFLTTYPFQLRKKLLNHSFELVCNQRES